MGDLDRLKQDVQEGRIDSDRLVDLIVTRHRQLQAAHQRIDEQIQRIEALEKQLGGAATTKVDEPFSVRAEEQRQQALHKKKRKRQRPGRRGRLKTADKIKLAERTEDVLPDGLDRSQCQLSHVRPVWRLEQGRAVLIAYQIYRGPNNRYARIPVVLGRGAFGLEIVIEIAYLVYV